MKVSGFSFEVSGKPGQSTRTDTRAHKEPGHLSVRVLSALPRPVSGLRPLAQPVEIHGVDCLLTQRDGRYAVMRDEQLVAQADTRFLAVARAALSLAPASALAGAP